MSESSSRTSINIAGVSSEDRSRPINSTASGDSFTSTPSITQSFHFSSGNPRVEETRGVMHLFRNDVASSPSELPGERKPLLCVLGVPNHMRYSDFCQFCGSFVQHMLEMRIVRNEGVEDRYSILIRFDEQVYADSFYEHFSGRHFSSLEQELCYVLFTSDVHYTGSIEHLHTSPPSTTEQPSCPVCLERLDLDTSGILTTLCNHSFHCSCISKWTDSSCPVCRYCQQQPEISICFICQTSENLWMCVICGFVGCGRYKDGHAKQHWKETQHCYALELETRRVWDYVGDNYVHRLILHKTDGEVVNYEGGIDPVFSEALQNSKVEAIVSEYNELLTTQLENQKGYFESLLREVEEENERETSEAVEKALRQNTRLIKLQARLDKCSKEKKFQDDIHDNLVRNQKIWESKIVEIEEREHKLSKVKDQKIKDLEEELMNMMACLESMNTTQQPSSD
ncbi:unnamed protein product [Cuscuta europaea]|uniref:BRCA1-associated protein n=1 Tax=Cuscuta europaea TaxID=41803 RepID=A0A9P0ZQ76_CUSEU|nr:unnamed protein product [Cuscuta europaea]